MLTIFRWIGAAVAVCSLSACVAGTGGRLVLAPSGPGSAASAPMAGAATVTLDLNALFPGVTPSGARVLAVSGTRKVKISIEGPGLLVPFERTATLGDDANLVVLEGVPVGRHRLISVLPLDATDKAVPGAALRVAGAISPGPNKLALSPASTVVGEVFLAMQGLDLAAKTAVLEQVDLTALTAALARYQRDLAVAHPSLIDAAAVASACYAANGRPPDPVAAFAVSPGRVLLRPTQWPSSTGATVTIADPASLPVFLEDEAMVVAPVVPGTWGVTVLPDRAGLPVFSATVTVKAGQATILPLTFGAGAAGVGMLQEVGAAVWGAVRVGGLDTLLVLGGVSRFPQEAEVDLTGGNLGADVARYTRAGGWVRSGRLDDGILLAATAVYQDRLYWFGGVGSLSAPNETHSYDPAGVAPPTTLSAIPGGRQLAAASAATVGDTIYVTGGVDREAYFGRVLAFNPRANTWSEQALPALEGPRADMAGAVIDGTWYLCGGAAGTAAERRPVGTTNAFDAKGPAWTQRASMPTPRSGAAAIAVGGKLWVVGGSELFGTASAAVEVYDPVTNSWSVRPPLLVPRAYPAVALIEGKIVVAGGIAGTDPRVDLPVADTEVLTP